MGTRSTISIKLPKNKTGLSIYCHWDGYLSNNGKLLVEHYCDTGLVRNLIKLGSLSSLAERCDLPCLLPHDYETPCEGFTVAYGRDRGEQDVAAKRFTGDLPEAAQDEEHNYLWDGEQWWHWEDRNYAMPTAATPKPLTLEMCQS